VSVARELRSEAFSDDVAALHGESALRTDVYVAIEPCDEVDRASPVAC
jgi:hypothetical protein